MKRIDRTGQRYGRLIAESFACLDARGRSRVMWNCLCDCGNRVAVSTDSLASGATQSCGCIRVEVTRERSTTHGATAGFRRSREYRAWMHAKDRCYRPASARYSSYGGRGIVMCDRWLHDFATFLADMGHCPPGHSIDRINVDGPYAPDNCRWATDSVQANNKRANVYVEHEGRRVTLSNLARAFGVNYKTLHNLVRTRGSDPVKTARAMAERKGEQ